MCQLMRNSKPKLFNILTKQYKSKKKIWNQLTLAINLPSLEDIITVLEQFTMELQNTKKHMTNLWMLKTFSLNIKVTANLLRSYKDKLRVLEKLLV